ncbi:MAG: signal peptidase I [Candidatus Magasanikbacteria bacterium CG_4_10_14_0_2_um_filter_37_12]|uniref:Signal peptidase I n=1 Tax=Candidatus Magasanikbacteria bacterium CG_4_10_14_0_2_um_filter_37_12 TaxID=1974637 RepID=A0A2M7V8D2_9BACT|nr:MAG: signal peptidase I [Candidatus Magasanikbacteria bacterium CG_4_10_14_0_2_um_filter_37_12]
MDNDNLEKKIETEEDGVLEEKGILEKIALFFLELVKISVLAGITIFLVRYFLFKPFYVKGESMIPSFYESEYLIVDELTYRFRDPERGEVIVFQSPTAPDDSYLKRVIGLPGERVRIENGQVTICKVECKKLEEPYINNVTSGDTAVTLGLDQYFVMGDNRGASYDSRRFGPINQNSIVGRTFLRGWPLSRITFFGSTKPNYDI